MLLDTFSATSVLTAPGTCLLNQLGGAAVVAVQLSNTYTGVTCVFQGSQDAGATWVTLTGYPVAGGVGVTGITTSAATGNWVVPVAGCAQFRVNVTAVGTGTLTVNVQTGLGEYPLVPQATFGVVADAGATTGVNPLLIGANASGSMGVLNRVNPGDGQTINGNLEVFALGRGYNETNGDRWRNNTDATVLASAAYNSTQTVNLKNYNGRGIQVVFDMTAVGATTNFTLSIQNKDAVSGKFITVLTGVAVSTNITSTYRVYPGLVVAANVDANGFITRDYKIVVTAAGSLNASTFSVGVQTML